MGDKPDLPTYIHAGYITTRLGWSCICLTVVCGVAWLLQLSWIRSRRSALAIVHLMLLLLAVYQLVFEIELPQFVSPVDSERWEYMPIVVGLTFLLSFIAYLLVTYHHRHKFLFVLVTFVFATAMIHHNASTYWKSEFDDYYGHFFTTDYFQAVDDLYPADTDEQPRKVSVLFARMYPFSGLQRDHWCIGAHAIPAKPKRFDTAEEVEKYFVRAEITHVLVMLRANRNRAPFELWLSAYPDGSELIWTDKRFEMYAIKRDTD